MMIIVTMKMMMALMSGRGRCTISLVFTIILIVIIINLFIVINIIIIVMVIMIESGWGRCTISS